MTPALRIALFVAVPVAVAAAGRPVATEVQLDGMYLSTGINPDGGEFDGFVHIERHADSFRVTWLMEQTEGDTILLVPTGVGTGIVHGGMLAVSFHDSGMDGIGLFHIEDEGGWLAGRWTLVGGDGGTYPEVLARLPADVPPPMRGDQPDEERSPAPQQIHSSIRRSGGDY